MQVTSDECRVAIVGAGAMAREHIRAFQDVPGVQVAGICSRTRARAGQLAEEFQIPLVCDSLYELYHSTRADLAILAVSAEQMHGMGVASTQFPWTIMLEKPPALSVSQ